MAECENQLRQERQLDGMGAAKATGVHCGRRKRLTSAQILELHPWRAAGVPVAALTQRYGMTRTRIYRYLAQAPHAPAPAADEPPAPASVGKEPAMRKHRHSDVCLSCGRTYHRSAKRLHRCVPVQVMKT